MLGLAEDTSHESMLKQGFGKVGTSGLILVNQGLRCLGIPAGHPDGPGGHTNRNRDVAMFETQPLAGEPVDIGGRSLDLRTIDPDGVSVHVVQSNEHDVEFCSPKRSARRLLSQKGRR